MPSTSLTFADRAAHRAWLASQAALPAGFRVGTASLDFVPVEVPKPARMDVTLIALDRPTPAFAAKFTRNAFPGAPVVVGRRRLDGAALGAIVVNNKVSNVCAPGGVEAAERICAEAARLLGIADEEVEPSFNCITVDSDTSTSDTVVLLSSRRRAAPPAADFRDALARVCGDLAEDVVRNGEGVHHVVRVRVTRARTFDEARGVAKAVANSPLLKAAVNGNDPNVGRLLCAVGKHAGAVGLPLDPAKVRMKVGGEVVLDGGAMRLDPEKERRLVQHLKAAELYATATAPDGLTFLPPVDYPP